LQNPFVVCKLFKKQDIVNGAAEPEESKSCEVEPAVSSPTVVDEVEMSEVSPVFPKTEETNPCDVAESSLVIPSECRSGYSVPEVTTTGVRMNKIHSFHYRRRYNRFVNLQTSFYSTA